MTLKSFFQKKMMGSNLNFLQSGNGSWAMEQFEIDVIVFETLKVVQQDFVSTLSVV